MADNKQYSYTFDVVTSNNTSNHSINTNKITWSPPQPLSPPPPPIYRTSTPVFAVDPASSPDLPDWLKKDGVFVKKKGGGKLSTSDKPEDFNDPNGIEEVGCVDNAQMVASKRKNGKGYRLLLDLDVPHYYVKSSSGNGHLIIDVDLSRTEHDEVMEMLASIGVLQSGYSLSAKIKKLGASLRLPWVKKGVDKTRNEQNMD